jgi:hypothetical protein
MSSRSFSGASQSSSWSRQGWHRLHAGSDHHFLFIKGYSIQFNTVIHVQLHSNLRTTTLPYPVINLVYSQLRTQQLSWVCDPTEFRI